MMQFPGARFLVVTIAALALAQQPGRESNPAALARIESTLGWRAAFDGCAAPSLDAAIDRAAELGLPAVVACPGHAATARSEAKVALLPRTGAPANAAQLRRSGAKIEGRPLPLVDARDAPEPLLVEFMNEVYRLDYKPLWLVDAASLPVYLRAAGPIAGYHANYASRTKGVRREGGVSEEEKALIAKAVPDAAPAQPRKPRRLLVIDSNLGRRGHPSIPHANLAVQLMAQRTQAFEAVFSNDPEMLKPGKLKEFDAVFLNNTIGDLFPTPELRDSFAAFIANGGGLVANHAVTVTETGWEGFGQILGGRGASHRMADEKVTIRVEDAASPVTAVFEGKPFEFADEIFRYQPPYARDQVRVLLSVDVARTDLNQGRCYGKCFRDDNDYPVAWIRAHGKGRVFYTTLGHNPYVFWEPRMVRMFLAAIQFAMGDLDADTTPRPQ